MKSLPLRPALFTGALFSLTLVWAAPAKIGPSSARPGGAPQRPAPSGRTGPSRPEPGSKEHAAEAIRLFEKDPDLRLPEAWPTPERQDWRFVVPGRVEYWVSRRTGSVWRVRYFLAHARSRPASEADARKIAREYAHARFGAFMKRTLRTTAARPVSGGSLVVDFHEIIPINGAYSGNRLSIDMHLRSGRVQSAELIDSGVSDAARTLPATTSLDAARIARRAEPAAYSASPPELRWISKGGGRLVWEVEMDAPCGRLCAEPVIAQIDAATGELAALDRLRGRTRPLAGEGECLLVMAGARGPYAGSGATLVDLDLRSERGVLWAPVQLRELFRKRGGAAPVTARFDGREFVAAEALLKNAPEVASSHLDLERRAITIYLDKPAPLLLARHLGLARPAAPGAP